MYLPAPVRNDKRILKFPILSARKPAEKIIYFVLTKMITKFVEELETRIIKFVKEVEKNYKATKIVKMHGY